VSAAWPSLASFAVMLDIVLRYLNARSWMPARHCGGTLSILCSLFMACTPQHCAIAGEGDVPLEWNSGSNGYIYFVCNYLGGPLVQLPHVTPAQVRPTRCPMLAPTSASGCCCWTDPACVSLTGMNRSAAQADFLCGMLFATLQRTVFMACCPQ